MLGGAIDGGHCDILFAYTNVRIVNKIANGESRQKRKPDNPRNLHERIMVMGDDIRADSRLQR